MGFLLGKKMHPGTYAADLAKFGLWFWILVRFGEQQGNYGQNKTKTNMKTKTNNRLPLLKMTADRLP